MAHASMGGREAGGANVKHREWRDRSEAAGTTIVTVDCLGRDRRAETGLNAAGRFKPRCGWAYRQQTGSAQARFRLVGAAQSPPISRSAEWPRACARGTALRCSSASTARCDGVQENTRIGDRPRRAISARPPRVHARVAVPTWRGCIGSRFTMWDRVGSTRKQRLTAHCYPLSRVTHRITAHIIIRFCGRQGEFRQNGVQASAQASPHGGMHAPKKLTRPDGEIRAGRVDRRRGSGGRERRSGL